MKKVTKPKQEKPKTTAKKAAPKSSPKKPASKKDSGTWESTARLKGGKPSEMEYYYQKGDSARQITYDKDKMSVVKDKKYLVKKKSL